MVGGITCTIKQFISFISTVVPNRISPTKMSKIGSRKQFISLPESMTIKRKNPKIAPNFPIKEKKP